MTFGTWWRGALAAAMLAAAPLALCAEEAKPAAAGAVEAESASASADAMFEFLVAELAAQRGDVEGALAIYQRMARELRDPHLARRAVELAVRARSSGRRSRPRPSARARSESMLGREIWRRCSPTTRASTRRATPWRESSRRIRIAQRC